MLATCEHCGGQMLLEHVEEPSAQWWQLHCLLCAREVEVRPPARTVVGKVRRAA